MKSMVTKYIKMEEEQESILQKAGEAIQNGELVVFPTETVYGIGANALNQKAVSKIFEAKGRASDNPLIVHISDISMLDNMVSDVGKIERKLMEAFWPGPLTIILKKRKIIPANVSGGLDTIGVRMPDNEIARKLIRYAGVPIAAPSANRSGRPSGTFIQDIRQELEGKVAYILDAGGSAIGIESTVVQVVEEKVHILRPGKITLEQINKQVELVEVDSHVFKPYQGTEKVLSPGMKYRHYAPKAKCVLVYSKDEEKLIDKINELISQNKKVLVLGRTKHLEQYHTDYKLDMGNTLEEIAHNIFRRLREVDEYSMDFVIIEGVEKNDLGLAIMNRLLRACGYRYMEV